jgi:hypothetical protein
MAPAREVAFELECFEWAEERLEVAGRWKGLGQHRLNRPVLTIDTDGRRKRIVAMPGGHFGAVGETWRASFSWPHDPTEITGAELEVGGNLVVELPLPDRRRRRRRKSAAAEQQTDDALRAETVALQGQVERLRAELAGREREIIALRAQLDEVTADEDDEEPAIAAPDDRTVEIRRLSDELDRLRGEQEAGAEAMTVEVQRLSAERDAARDEIEAAVAAERARWQEDLDELRQAFADAAVEAEETRDRHRAELEALEERLRAEHEAVERLEAELAERDEAAVRELAEVEERAFAAAWAELEARQRAAVPPTEPMPPRDDESPDEPLTDEPSAAGPDEPSRAAAPGAAPASSADESSGAVAPGDTADTASADRAVAPVGSSAGPATQPMPPPEPARDDQGRDDGLDAIALDAPGPLRAGSRPTTPPGEELPGTVPPEPGGSTALQALKARFEGLLGTNGHKHDEELDEEQAVPRPLRTASAARARAGSAVAARRSPGEVWATRVLAAIVVAVLLTAFVLILAYIA